MIGSILGSTCAVVALGANIAGSFLRYFTGVGFLFLLLDGICLSYSVDLSGHLCCVSLSALCSLMKPSIVFGGFFLISFCSKFLQLIWCNTVSKC